MGTTFALIMCVDTIECCLHCLRLHWVEFMNKFFDGQGIAYVSYDFNALAREIGDEE